MTKGGTGRYERTVQDLILMIRGMEVGLRKKERQRNDKKERKEVGQDVTNGELKRVDVHALEEKSL